MTSGTGILHHIFDHFGPVLDREIGQRQNGVLISNGQGKALAYALFNLQERGKLMAAHGDEVYEGQIIGIHSRDNDLVVNPLKGKKLTNMRAAGRDENIILVPPIRYTLEQAMEFIADDELVEVTPTADPAAQARAQGARAQARGRAEEETARIARSAAVQPDCTTALRSRSVRDRRRRDCSRAMQHNPGLCSAEFCVPLSHKTASCFTPRGAVIALRCAAQRCR